YLAPSLAITGLSQNSGSVGGGTSVTISGAFLDGATEVDFGGVPGVIVPGSDTGSSLQVTSPASTGFLPGAVDVTVKGTYGTTPVTAADKFTYVTTVPSITGITPDASSTSGLTRVTITGSGLVGITEVDFGGIPAYLTSLIYNPDGSVTISNPGHASGQ